MQKKEENLTGTQKYRLNKETSGYVRADIDIPLELKAKVQTIAKENGWKYLETLGALAQLGTEVYERDKLTNDLNALMLKTQVLSKGDSSDLTDARTQASIPSFNAVGAAQSLAGCRSVSAGASCMDNQIYNSNYDISKSVLNNFITKRKAD